VKLNPTLSPFFLKRRNGLYYVFFRRKLLGCVIPRVTSYTDLGGPAAVKWQARSKGRTEETTVHTLLDALKWLEKQEVSQ
jgi:hypothetical protein